MTRPAKASAFPPGRQFRRSRRSVSGNGHLGSAGFTLVEVLVLVALLVLVLAVSFPALRQALHRSQLETATQQVASALFAARYQAVRQGVDARVDIAFEDQTITTLLDRTKQGTFASRVGFLRIAPPVALQGPEDELPHGEQAIEGFEQDDAGGVVMFRPDGTAAAEGAVRLKGAGGEVYEIRLSPAASARIAVRAWDDLGGRWVERDR